MYNCVTGESVYSYPLLHMSIFLPVTKSFALMQKDPTDVLQFDASNLTIYKNK